MKIKSAFRIGNYDPQNSRGPRPIIAELSSVKDKITCFKSSKKLKGSRVYLADDVSKETAEIRRKKIPALKQKREEGFIAYFSGTDIITRPKKTFTNPNPSSDNVHQPKAVDDQPGASAPIQTRGRGKRRGQ